MKRFIFLSAIVIFVSAAACAEPIKLRYQYTAGDQLHYLLNASGTGNVSITITTGAGGDKSDTVQEIPVDIALLMALNTNVTEVNSIDRASLVSRIVKYRLTQGDQTIVDFDAETSYKKDSKKPDATMLAALKAPLTMVVDPLGAVYDVKGYVALSKLAPQFDLAKLVSKMQQPFPEKAVDVGDTWTQSMPLDTGDSPGNNEKQIVSDFKFLGYEQVKGLDCARISSHFSGDISALMQNVLAGIPMAQNSKVDFLFMEFNSEMFFAHKEGVLVAIKFELNQNMVMTIDMPAPERNARMRMKMDMLIEGVYELE